jgi:glycosyltransferase involved in cell wall biosynthesis
MDSEDLITIIIATYNRSNVLRFSVQSVINQTYQNWELLVIGDCCTDDTAEVMSNFNNPKIKFINLKKNIGEQSGPNNFGIKMAQGKYIALLNHDDLWFPNHLEDLHQTITETKSDLVYSLFYPVPVDENPIVMPMRNNNQHDLIYGSPASTWLFNKNLFSKLGPWKYFRELYEIPSQEWLKRVSKTSKIVVFNAVSVIAIQSGARINSYKNRIYLENELYYDRMNSNPEKLLKEIYFEQMTILSKHDRQIFYHVKAFVRNSVIYILTKFGLRPGAVLFISKSKKKKGGYIDKLREIRGLSEVKQ